MSESESTVAVTQRRNFFHPILRVLFDNVPRNRKALIDDVLQEGEWQKSILSTSGYPKAAHRIDWASRHLMIVGFVERSKDGLFTITEDGIQAMHDNVGGLTKTILYANLDSATPEEEVEPQDDTPEATKLAVPAQSRKRNSELDPHIQADRGISQINDEVSSELLKLMHENDPDFLEHAIVKLLKVMEYGSDGHRIGGTGDGGMDGVIMLDTLGLDKVYIQAKRYAPHNTIGRPPIQAFTGALEGRGATRGIFITTSRFTPQALSYVRTLTKTKVILIDGQQLAEYMIQYQVGVHVHEEYEVVGVDQDFFR